MFEEVRTYSFHRLQLIVLYFRINLLQYTLYVLQSQPVPFIMLN